MTGFGQLLRAEWTKFRTVRGWVIGAVVAALAMVALGVVSAEGSRRVVQAAPGETHTPQAPPTGPDGEVVTDNFAFLHRALDGDGSITVRLSSMTGGVVSPDATTSPGAATTGNIEPWAKAGVIVKESTAPGSAYAAVMLTGGHGVRMQYNFTGDIAGPSASIADPRWLRLVRAGSTLTGYESADGTSWTEVGAIRLHGLSPTVQVGMFVASPPRQNYTQQLGGISSDMEFTRATAAFDNVSVQGRSAATGWTDTGKVGDVTQDGDTFTVQGSGDIAPNVDETGGAIERTLVGSFAGLIVLIVLGVLFVTTEYRRGMIRTTFAASPRRGPVLAAKAVVIGAVSFVTGLIAAAIALPLCEHILRGNGNIIFPVSLLTEVRLVVGTAALLAVAAVLALAVGTMMRRSAGAVATVLVLIVLPYILVSAAVLPVGAANWVLRLTPAAAYAIQQSLPAYPQVDGVYTPAQGFYPLGPWTGFAVLCVWTAAALGLATYLLRRRDA